MDYGQTARTGVGIGVGVSSPTAPQETIQSRLDDVLGIQAQCEQLAVEIGTKIIGPQPSGENQKIASSGGVHQSLLEVRNRAVRLRDILAALTREVA